ncbi:MAG: hypothetical protein KJZ87_16845 [Thermoguttaceae bacterium]|nr:hypothetical protein [Thermoguttaceae bacterium]
MPRILAIEWSDVEARLVMASGRGGRVTLERAWRLDLRGLPDDGGEAEAAIHERLAAALVAERLGKHDALVAVGRASVELRELTLPPAPDDELPDLARFQALREFNNLDDDSPLDFLPLDEDPEQPRRVLAAGMRSEVFGEIRATCAAVGLKPLRLALRPCAVASLLVRSTGASDAVQLLVDLAAEEVELTILAGRKVTFVRQTRLMADPLVDESAHAALAAEIRRTLAAAQSQSSSRRVESVALCGSGSRHTALAESLSQRVSLPVTAFDPFAGVALGGTLARGLPEAPERFAALVGMLCDEFTDTAPAFDFLHPRQRPAPPSRRNVYVLAGLAAAMVVIAILVISRLQSSELLATVHRLQNESKALEKNLPAAVEATKAAAEVQAWVAAEVNWLEELNWLAEKFPPAQDAALVQLKLNANAGRGEMTLDGLARNVEAVTRLDESLRDEEHRLAGRSKGEGGARGPYSLQFRSSLLFDAPGMRESQASNETPPAGGARRATTRPTASTRTR